MIERVNEKTSIFKKRYKLVDDIMLYLDAFNNTTIKIDMMFTDDHNAYNELHLLLKYYFSRKKECIKELKYIKKILDENTTVQLVSEKPYYSTRPKSLYRFTKFDFSKEMKEAINKKYKEVVAKIKSHSNNYEK